jgi:hypothetical protein
MIPYGGMRAVREQVEYCLKLNNDLVQKSSAVLKSTLEVSEQGLMEVKHVG